MQREVTQFSASEFNAFLAEKREPANTREKYMKLLADCLAVPPNKELDAVGGWENIQRVRAVENSASEGRFVFVPKLPVHMLEQKKREERRKRAQATLNSLADTAALLLMAAALKPAPKPSKRDQARKRQEFLKSPEGKKAAYAEALKQDQRQRRQPKNPCAEVKVATGLDPKSSAPSGGRFIAKAKAA